MLNINTCEIDGISMCTLFKKVQLAYVMSEILLVSTLIDE